jgi:hypothetical protein
MNQQPSPVLAAKRPSGSPPSHNLKMHRRASDSTMLSTGLEESVADTISLPIKSSSRDDVLSLKPSTNKKPRSSSPKKPADSPSKELTNHLGLNDAKSLNGASSDSTFSSYLGGQEEDELFALQYEIQGAMSTYPAVEDYVPRSWSIHVLDNADVPGNTLWFRLVRNDNHNNALYVEGQEELFTSIHAVLEQDSESLFYVHLMRSRQHVLMDKFSIRTFIQRVVEIRSGTLTLRQSMDIILEHYSALGETSPIPEYLLQKVAHMRDVQVSREEKIEKSKMLFRERSARKFTIDFQAPFLGLNFGSWTKKST